MSLFYRYSEDNGGADNEKLKGTANGNIDMSTFLITQSSTPTNGYHSTNKKYVDDEKLKGTANGNINMGTIYKITQSTAAVNNNDRTNKKYLVGNYMTLSGGRINGDVSMRFNRITNLGAAVDDTDPVSKIYMNSFINTNLIETVVQEYFEKAA